MRHRLMVDSQILIAYHWKKYLKRKAKKKAAKKKKGGLKKSTIPAPITKATSAPISQPVKKTPASKPLKEKKSAPIQQKNDSKSKSGARKAENTSPQFGDSSPSITSEKGSKRRITVDKNASETSSIKSVKKTDTDPKGNSNYSKLFQANNALATPI